MVQVQGAKLCLLLAVCVYLNLLDLLATLSWCQTWGWLMEMNPGMRFFSPSIRCWGALLK